MTNSKTLVGRCRDRPQRALPLTCPNVKNFFLQKIKKISKMKMRRNARKIKKKKNEKMKFFLKKKIKQQKEKPLTLDPEGGSPSLRRLTCSRCVHPKTRLIAGMEAKLALRPAIFLSSKSVDRWSCFLSIKKDTPRCVLFHSLLCICLLMEFSWLCLSAQMYVSNFHDAMTEIFDLQSDRHAHDFPFETRAHLFAFPLW